MNSRIEDLTNLVYELIEDKIRKNNGDIDKTIESGRVKRGIALQRRQIIVDEACKERDRKIEVMEAEHSKIVAKAFGEGLRPSIQGKRHEWKDLVKYETEYGPVELLLSDIIIDRASEFVKDYAQTREYVVNKYTGFGYTYTISTKDHRGTAKVPIEFVPA